jgi:hypothetical protein
MPALVPVIISAVLLMVGAADVNSQSRFDTRALDAAIAGAHSGQAQSSRPSGKEVRILAGVGIGGGLGLIFGEYVFGRTMDMPHGPDMLLGAAIGGTVGGLIAWHASRDSVPSRGFGTDFAVAPLVTRSTRGVQFRIVQ